MRAAGPQLIGAISAAAGGWWLQTTALTDYSSFVRILLSTGFCACIYLVVVVGLFRLTEPIKVAAGVVQDQFWRNR
jgi:PST family polysaccharide transporter